MCKFCPVEVQLAFLAAVEKVTFACHWHLHFTLPDLHVFAFWILLCNIFLLVIISSWLLH